MIYLLDEPIYLIYGPFLFLDIEIIFHISVHVDVWIVELPAENAV